MNYAHTTVLKQESIDALRIKKDGIYVDCTLGGAGHSIEILKQLEHGKLIAFDQDEDAIKNATKLQKQFNNKLILVHANFIELTWQLKQLNIGEVDGVLADLGVSSYQLDEENRGFSYRTDALLDMRMDMRNPINAQTIVNEYSETRLAEIIFAYGEERFAKRIARAIVRRRNEKKIETIEDLNSIIRAAVTKQKGKHPSRRTFQALRIEVNKELEVLQKGMEMMFQSLKPAGRLAIISFHSLEDRLVKNYFQYLEKDCICGSKLPVCCCNKKREGKIINKKPITPTEEEQTNNRRSRTAKLRIIEKCGISEDETTKSSSI